LPPAFDPAGATGRRNLQRIYELGRELTGASPARRLEGNGIPDLLLPPASEVIDLIVAKPTVNGGRRGAKRLDRPATSAESSGSSAATAVRTSGAAVHEAITARVIDMLEHGIVPWRKGWEAGLPRNMEGRKYRGINAFMLAFAGRRNEAGEYIPFDSPYWITMYQANKRGGHVKAGEHATPVIWYDQRQVEDKDPDTGEERKRHYWLLRAYACFNLDQVEGVAPPEDAKPMVPVTPLEAFEALVAKMPGPPKISYDAGGPAFWRPTDDTIHLPPLKRWESAIELAVTKGHELTHSTGHEKRLGRPEVVNGGYDYTHHRDSRGREELTAEMGGALLAAEAGVVLEDLTERSASYVTGWIQTIRGDASALVAAGSAAQKAVDYIIGIDLKKTTETS
jgi:antirestriction protein ArdC